MLNLSIKSAVSGASLPICLSTKPQNERRHRTLVDASSVASGQGPLIAWYGAAISVTGRDSFVQTVGYRHQAQPVTASTDRPLKQGVRPHTPDKGMTTQSLIWGAWEAKPAA